MNIDCDTSESYLIDVYEEWLDKLKEGFAELSHQEKREALKSLRPQPHSVVDCKIDTRSEEEVVFCDEYNEIMNPTVKISLLGVDVILALKAQRDLPDEFRYDVTITELTGEEGLVVDAVHDLLFTTFELEESQEYMLKRFPALDDLRDRLHHFSNRYTHEEFTRLEEDNSAYLNEQ